MTRRGKESHRLQASSAIVTSVSARVREVREEERAKAPIPKVSTPEGMTTDGREEQSAHRESGMAVREVERMKVERLVHPAKAKIPTDVTVLGIVKEVRLVAP